MTVDPSKSVLRVGVISDTHGLLRNEVYAVFEDVDEIIHAGDVGDPAILTELEVIAPIHAVYGNVDGWDVRERVQEQLELKRLGRTLAVIHGHQWGSPRPGDLVERFPGRDVIIYGHTHRPRLEELDGSLVVNPGSAGRKRFNLPVSAALLTLRADAPPEARLLELVS